MKNKGFKELTKKSWIEAYHEPLTLESIQKALMEVHLERPKTRITKITTVPSKPSIPDFPTLEVVQESEWYKTRPKVIQLAIDAYPPTQLYRFKDSQKQFYIVSYSAPEDLPEDKWREVTLSVNKIGVGGSLSSMGLGSLDTNGVFGVFLDDIEPLNY